MIIKKDKIFIIIISIVLISIFIVENTNSIIMKNKIENLLIENINEKKYDYLEIPSIDLKQIIVKGINKENLDKDYITTNDDVSSDDNITLAGHNKKSVFRKLHNIKLGDIIYINHNKKYTVIKKEIILDTDINKLSTKYNSLNLITCTFQHKKRLLIIALLND